MGNAVSWLLEVEIDPDQIGEFRALMQEMVSSTEHEPGTLAYEWFISDDDSVVHIYERYADSAATMVHAQAFGERFAERFVAAITPISFNVYGSPSDDVKAALAGLGPTYVKPFGGFAR
jgi:quinol monooxygenase YgiN